MARRERIVLDPEEVAVAGRIEIDIHSGSIQVDPDGPDWGDYEVNQFLAKRAIGLIPVDEEFPNRVITIPLILGATGDFDAARIAVEAWAAKVNHKGGGWLKREIIGGSYGEAGGKLFSDVVKATLTLGGGTSQARDGIDPDALLTLEALPDFYGERIVLPAFEGNGEAAETFEIIGTLPGRAEITVTEKSGRDQLALPWHFRCCDYSADAPWAVDVETFELFGAAEKATLAGSKASKVVRHPNLSTQWTPVAAKTLSHRGLYDVLVRVHTTSATPPEIRLVYDVGDLINPVENVAMEIPGSNGFYLVWLKQVNLQELPIGTHRWRPLLQARGAQGGENVSLDRLWFFSATESSGAPTSPRLITQGLTAPLVFDGFNQSAGAATGKSPGVGAAYAVATNSDTTDFEIDAATHRLVRNAAGDTGTIASPHLRGRAIGSGTAQYTTVAMAADFDLPIPTSGMQHGHMLRWKDASNFIAIYLDAAIVGGSRVWRLQVLKMVGGASSFLASVSLNRTGAFSGRLETGVRENELRISLSGLELGPYSDTDLAVGAPLEKGRAFLYDYNELNSLPRYYDNLEIWVPNFEAVNFANQKAWLSHQGLYRLGPTGEAYGPMLHQDSDLPRVPVSGPEGNPVELAVMTSRSDLAGIQDSGASDPLGVQLAYEPCWSQVPAM